MTRILERLDDKTALLDTVLNAPDGDPLLQRYRGTELVDCFAIGCERAVVVTGPLDIEVTLELADNDGWLYHAGKHFCPDHHDAANNPAATKSVASVARTCACSEPHQG